jgi:hypothetical protein
MVAVAIVVLLAVAAGLVPFLVPGTLFERDAGRLAAAMIFAASYVALAEHLAHLREANRPFA